MFLTSILSNADSRVRITPDIEQSICELAGTDKFAKALPNLELALKVVVGLHEELTNGGRLVEQTASGKTQGASFGIEPKPITEAATVRTRIPKALEGEIIGLAERLGLSLRADGKPTQLSSALPYLKGALDVAHALKQSLIGGSRFYAYYPNGEKVSLKFLL